MKIWIHKIYWPKQYNSYGKDLDFTITDTDCYVTEVSHPCARWAVEQNEAWIRVSAWFQKKGATITLGEPREVEDDKK